MRTAQSVPLPQTASELRSRPCVLLLEDDPEMRRLLVEVLSAEGCQVDAYPDGTSWLSDLGTEDCTERLKRWQAIISDVRMPGLNGLTALRIAKLRSRCFPAVIVITAFGDEETYADAERLGAAAVLDKPFDPADLIAKVREIAPP